MPTPSELESLRTLWTTYMLNQSEDLKQEILRILATFDLTVEEWEEHLEELPGFSPWWQRVRLEFLGKAAAALHED